MSVTRKEYAAAVKAAHDALHEAEDFGILVSDDYPYTKDCIERAHEALHAVYSPTDPPIDCATRDPEAHAMGAELRAMLDRPLPCGHTLGDLVGGFKAVTKCGQCLREKQTGTGRFAPDVQPVEIGDPLS